MKHTRHIEISVEHEVVSIRSQMGQGQAALCEECGHQVNMLSPQAAAEFAGTTPRKIYRWIEERKIHFVESASGKILVCSESLASVSGQARKSEDR
jgi:hypothetical protein